MEIESGRRRTSKDEPGGTKATTGVTRGKGDDQEREGVQALSRLENDRKVLEAQRRALAESGLSEEEVEWYERVRRREFAVFHDVRDIGRTLIALRIANGMSQRELAERLGVSEAQISRDERDEYHSITVERVQRILDVMGESLRMQVEDKPLVIA